jgi:hypothetical protein
MKNTGIGGPRTLPKKSWTTDKVPFKVPTSRPGGLATETTRTWVSSGLKRDDWIISGRIRQTTKRNLRRDDVLLNRAHQ